MKNIFVICLLCFGITAMSYGQAVVSIDPAEVASPAVGGTLSVNIKITNGTGVAGYDVTVGFDTSALQYVEIKNANYLPTGAFAAPPRVSGNRVTLAAISLSGAASATSGTLATLTFRVVTAKASTIELVEVILSDSAANELPLTKRNGEVVVAAFLATDLNKDGNVNVLDLTLVARDLGKTGSPMGDVTGDGAVNVLDLVRVAQDLGKTTTPAGGGTPVGGGTPANGGTTPPQSDPYENMELIPAGEFRMGSDDEEARPWEKPVHTVYVDAFYIDKYEVTNAQYAAFLNVKGKHVEANREWIGIGTTAHIDFIARKYQVRNGQENKPVMGVSWYGAMAYAEWAGKRLPTEAEWEKAARGGLRGVNYPWGNNIDSSRARYSQPQSLVFPTVDVGTYPPNGYGLYDMVGNVDEWVLDLFNPDFYSISPKRNPVSGGTIQWILDNYTRRTHSCIARGGSWGSGRHWTRVSARNNVSASRLSRQSGFRCVKEVEP